MDAAWFKQRSRERGLTINDLGAAIGRDRAIISRFYTGRQKMTLAQAREIAKALEQPLPEVLERAGLAAAREARELEPSGFSEGEVARWLPADQVAPDADEIIADALGRGPGVDIWIVGGKSMQLGGYLPGDRILVDTHRASSAKSGDLVVAQVYDWVTGSANTVFRRFMAPTLIAHSLHSDDWRALIVDHDRVVISGVVTASWRVSDACGAHPSP